MFTAIRHIMYKIVKIYQRIDRPPSLPFGCEQLVIFYYSLFGEIFDRNCHDMI